MVHTCKNREEFEIFRKDSVNMVGGFFEYNEITTAKSLRLFDNIRRVIKLLEDKGTDVYYMCTEDKKRGGKWLLFSMKGCTIMETKKLLNVIKNTAYGKPTNFLTLEDLNDTSGGSGKITGSVGCCPLF